MSVLEEQVEQMPWPSTAYLSVVERAGVPVVWRVRVEGGAQDRASWLSANDRSGWQRRARVTRAWRTATSWQARRHLRAVRLDRAQVVAHLHFPDLLRRDPGNYAPTVKAAVDGLVDAGLLPDDDHRHLDGPDLRIGEPTGRGPMVAAAVTLTITDLGRALR